MLDDCDPLGAKMEPAIEAESQRLAEATADNLGGVHWTSGDVPYKYDAFPMREAHGGYSGLSDISFPADAVYPTVYKPTLGLGPGDFAQAMGTKANKAAALHEHAGEDTETRAAKEVAEKKTAVVAEEAQEDDKLQAKEDKVEAALRTQHKEEAIAATDKAVGDKVMADAEKSEDEEKRTRLLKAATDEYKKAAEATEVAKQTGKRAAAAAAAASARPGATVSSSQGKDGVSVRLPSSMAEGTVTISFSKHGAKVDKEDENKADALQTAHELVKTERRVREEAKALAARENAKTAAVVARNELLNKALAGIVPDISSAGPAASAAAGADAEAAARAQQ